ncbi:MAG: hypothetical protein AAAB17_09680, partial [Pseudomonas sp.]
RDISIKLLDSGLPLVGTIISDRYLLPVRHAKVLAQPLRPARRYPACIGAQSSDLCTGNYHEVSADC